MTTEEAQNLKTGEEVFYGKSYYEVAEIKEFPHGIMIGIYDEPPTKHIDYLNPKNVMKVYPCNRCQGEGCLDCAGFGKYPSA